jgi:hypothetical protein
MALKKVLALNQDDTFAKNRMRACLTSLGLPANGGTLLPDNGPLRTQLFLSICPSCAHR